ncbi:MAG: DNA mismatch repair endonuclease MutL [Zetaproteobacteria bacterium]|nr:MAG: DNA mismatch repair endonuclease MutL [Zetaproteobacteria bacterium]
MSDPITSIIHVLPPAVANQIAAGEVVERPSSIVKELVENSMDAGAAHIRVRIGQAGKKLIEVDDDGCGMSDADARLSLKRHATSKISTAEELHTIASHGFRGEALPSIAAVSRLEMHTALKGASAGTEVTLEGASEASSQPAPPRHGTRVRVRDLFFNTPARLRFLRTDRTEEAVIMETLRALALANGEIGLRLECDGRQRLDVPAGQTREERVSAIMGTEFTANQYPCHLEHDGTHVDGFFGLPTHHHRNAKRMHFFINGRVVHDKQLISALKAGYRDVLFHDRFPQAVVWIEMDPAEVDVNVHPAKREVRFRKPQDVRAAVIACARAAIERMGQTVSSSPARQALQAMHTSTRPQSRPASMVRPHTPHQHAPADTATLRNLFSAPHVVDGVAESPTPEYRLQTEQTLNLGMPLAQIHRCYILAQTDDGVVLVDQHAAAERIRYEKFKCQLLQGTLARQSLLTPAIWQPDTKTSAWLHDYTDELTHFGFEVEAKGEERFAIIAMPAMVRDEAPVALVSELVESIMCIGTDAEGYGRILERWLGNRACKSSIKSGRVLGPEEQEALLRKMEETPNIAQCNHGRPTYVKLSLSELERLFGRKE